MQKNSRPKGKHLIFLFTLNPSLTKLSKLILNFLRSKLYILCNFRGMFKKNNFKNEFHSFYPNPHYADQKF